MADWYSTKEASETILRFHQTFARQPPEMEEAKQRHTTIMNELNDYLKGERKILSRFEFTGSAYEGLKVGGKELEFDIMFVLNDGQLLTVEKDPVWNLYGHLKPKNQDAAEKFKAVTEDGEIIPIRVRDRFHGELQKWLNRREKDTPKLRGEIKLRYGGPAIRANVFKDGKLWYFVDLVPAYEVNHQGRKEVYVAKPRDADQDSWRHSFSVEEKRKLQNIDGPDNGCRKKVVRILKVVRDNEAGLDKMISFYLKSKIIQMSDRQPQLDWSEKNLPMRLRDVMLEISEDMERGVLKHHFDNSVNLLHDLSQPVRMNIASRLKKIATNARTAKEVFKCLRK